MDAADVALAQYVTAAGNLRSSFLQLMAQLWAALTAWRDADADTFTARAVPLASGAQRAMATLTAAYLAQSVSSATGSTLVLPSLDYTDLVGSSVRDADPDVVYRRPFTTVWTSLSDGQPLDAAVQAGARRLQSIAATDLQLAKTHTSKTVLAGERRVVGYRRVLTGAHSCGLCVVASTQRYHKADLMPIHPSCDCATAAIIGDSDPGQVVDEQALADVQQSIQDTFGQVDFGAREIGDELRSDGKPLLYRDVLVTHEHGEIGPVLGVRGQAFTGPNDIPGG